MEKKDITGIRDRSCSSSNDQVPFSSNCVRLSPSEWLIVAIIFSAVFCLAPTLWERVEKVEPEPDYRLPYDLSSDYWLYKRYCRWACSRHETLVVGDSVVWGHFVPVDNTLSHYLNDLAGREQFANLGADGTHPAALEGLLRYYATDISNKILKGLMPRGVNLLVYEPANMLIITARPKTIAKFMKIIAAIDVGKDLHQIP